MKLEQSKRRAWPVLLICSLLLLPILYPLSMPLAYCLEAQGYSPIPFDQLETVYQPVHELWLNHAWFGESMNWYTNLWGETTSSRIDWHRFMVAWQADASP